MMNEGAFERSMALVGDTWMLRNKALGWVPCFVLLIAIGGCELAYLSMYSSQRIVLAILSSYN